MKRKKISTKPPAKEKKAPAKKENPDSENLGTHSLSEGEDSYPQEVEEKILEQTIKKPKFLKNWVFPKACIYYGSKCGRIRSSAV